MAEDGAIEAHSRKGAN